MRYESVKNTILALLSAVLLIPCFPRFDLWFLAWIALVPLFIALKDAGPKTAFGLSFLTGIGFLMGAGFWITGVSGFTWVDFILGGIYWSSYYGFFGLVFALLSRNAKLPRIVAGPAAWVSSEYLRSHFFFLNFPLGLLGHTQYLNLPIIQIASLTGVYGVSFLIVMVNAALSEVIRNRFRSLHPVIVPLVIVVLSIFYGLHALSSPPAGETISITVIQGNLPQKIRDAGNFRFVNLDTHIRLTKEALPDKTPSLIVWPEVAAQGSLRTDSYVHKAVSALAKEAKTFLLVGSAERFKYGDKPSQLVKAFNSAFLISPAGEIKGQYNKIILFPFSEYLPYESVIPWPSRYYAKTANFIPGTEYTIFDLGRGKFGVTICWENMVPEFFRRFANTDANFMVNITNESLFGESAAPYVFMSVSVFRAVETRMAIARAAYTGISGFIDPYGRILATVHDGEKEIFVEGHLTQEIPLSRQRTFYTVYGDIFAFLNLSLCGAFLALSFLRRRPLKSFAGVEQR